MRKFLAVLLLPLTLIAQNYPVAKKNSKIITNHGISFTDDYSWMHNLKNADLNKWVENQNTLYENHLKETNTLEQAVAKIKEYNKYVGSTLPIKKGKYFYMKYRVAADKPTALYYRATLNQRVPVEIADPYKIYKNDNAVLMNFVPSRGSKLLACSFSTDGSDRQEIRFIDFNTKEPLKDVLGNVKFTTVAWNANKGVFYKKNANINTMAVDSTYQLYYHEIGHDQKDDRLIFDTSASEQNFTFSVKEDKLFIIEQNKAQTHKTYYYASLLSEPFELVKFIDNDPNTFQMQYYHKGRIYFNTKNYDWGEVRSFNLHDRKDETVVVSQFYTHLLLGSYHLEDKLICLYKMTGKYYISIYDSDGKFISKCNFTDGVLPTIKFYDRTTNDLYITVESYVTPYQNFKFNIDSGEFTPFYNDYIKPKVTLFPLDYFELKTVTFVSRDGKDIPINIIYKKGLKLDGSNPALLQAYGGFGNVSSPNFDPGVLYFLSQGGVYAYAEVRGGGEKGLKWHKDGKGINKKNSINDFIDAAEFLIREKYTSPQKLAITGGSHGGLLVGAAMTKRPELFKVAIPVVGVLDMAVKHNYTVGAKNSDEYGYADKKEEYTAMMDYSPYHNIREDVNYPITLIRTSANDDRVPPFHSYKFAAKLQNRSAQKNPVYLQTQQNSGHNGNISTFERQLRQLAEFYSFLLYHLK